jgi:hypothetical protein
VFATTALAPGAIPPFGQLFGRASWRDSGRPARPRVNFNAGDHALSVRPKLAHCLASSNPRAALTPRTDGVRPGPRRAGSRLLERAPRARAVPRDDWTPCGILIHIRPTLHRAARRR